VNERVPLAQALKPGCACVSVSVLKDKTGRHSTAARSMCASGASPWGMRREKSKSRRAAYMYEATGLGLSEALSGPALRLIEYGCDKGVQGS